MTGPIQSVVVLGSGITGLSAAAAFARTLPQLRVTIVETAADPAALADLLPGSTSAIHRFHAAIGLETSDLLRSRAATPRLALRFENWGANGEPWFHVHGEHGGRAGSIAFHHYWARARREGRALPYHLYAAAGMMAEANKFVPPAQEPGSPLASYDHALRIDPERYRALLAKHCAALGAKTVPGSFAQAKLREDGGIATLVLEGGARVGADLFIDASGPGAALLSLLDPGFEDWSDHYPCRSLRIGDMPPVPPAVSDTLRATPQGWRWQAPLPDRTVTGTLSAADEAVNPIRPGRRPAPWVHNVLAVGDAALALDPLHWLPLHAAQQAILRALELLPDSACNPVETGEYNRRARLESERLRDFQLLHHRQAGWDKLPPSPGLAEILQQFERRGRLVRFDEDSLTAEMWLAALLGLGVVPQAMDPLADTLSPDDAASGMDALAKGLLPVIDRLPDYAAWLGQAVVRA